MSIRKAHVNGGFPNVGVHFGGPYNEDYSIWGLYIGVPPFRETTKYLVGDVVWLVHDLPEKL